jgi:hypothetical protein
VVAGAPSSRLVDLVVAPQVLVQHDSSRAALRLNAAYYITKQIIPALERVLSLVGADARSWFYHMRKPTRLLPQKRPAALLALPSPPLAAAARATAGAPAAGDGASAGGRSGGFGLAAALAGYQQPAAGAAAGPGSSGSAWRSPTHNSNTNSTGGAGFFGVPAPGAASAGGGAAGSATIDTFYLSRHCAVCDELTRAGQPLCERCLTSRHVSAVVLASRAARLERQHQQLLRLCQSCGGGGGRNVRHGGVVCTSLDCGLYYERWKVVGELRSMSALAAAGMELL